MHRSRRFAGTIVSLALLVTAACAPRLQPAGEAEMVPALHPAEEVWQAGDGRILPLRRWLPGGRMEAIVLALHGFNDYSNAFTEAGIWWAEQGIATYAPDQRGFGESPYRGLWPGQQRLAEDVAELTRLLRRRHPDMPLYWLGDSMGGAVTLTTLEQTAARPDGLILVAPAVWGRDTMPWYYNATLWLASHTIPWKTFTGRNLGIQASDNIEMLRRLARDPLFIKATRVDTIYGLVDLMDAASHSRPEDVPVLLLYGAKDEVIPREPIERYIAALRGDPEVNIRVAVYGNGWHMLLRDLQAETVWRDISSWIHNRDAALPSGAVRQQVPLFAAGEPE